MANYFQPEGMGGCSHIDMVYVYVPTIWDAILQNLV